MKIYGGIKKLIMSKLKRNKKISLEKEDTGGLNKE
jgi:hypothetical protein